MASLLIVLATPRVLSWRDKQVSSLVAKSKAAQSTGLREEYLREAMMIGWGGEAAPRALANYYVSVGRYDKAWHILQNWPLTRDYVQLGDYALKSQDYSVAQRFYARAVGQKATPEAYVGLAAALFNLGSSKNGCANAAKATKLNLDSSAAEQMAAVCLLLQPNQTLLQEANYPVLQSIQLKSDRGIGTFLIANRIYSAGEKRLLASNQKTASDWLALALLANARGDYNLTVERAEQGIKLNRSDLGLNTLLAQTYRTMASPKATLYEERLKAIPNEEAR